MTALLYIICCSVVLGWQFREGESKGALKPKCERPHSQLAFRHNGSTRENNLRYQRDNNEKFHFQSTGAVCSTLSCTLE